MNEATIWLNENEPPPDSLLLLWQGLIDEAIKDIVNIAERQEASQEAMCQLLKTWQSFPPVDVNSEESITYFTNSIRGALIRLEYEEKRQGKLNGQDFIR